MHSKKYKIDIYNTIEIGSGVQELYVYGLPTPTLEEASARYVSPDFNLATLLGKLTNVDAQPSKTFNKIFTGDIPFTINCSYSSLTNPTTIPDSSGINNEWSLTLDLDTKWVIYQIVYTDSISSWSDKIDISLYLPVSSFDVSKIQWKGKLSSAPESPYFNWIYQDSSTSIIYRYDESSFSWIPLILTPDQFLNRVSYYTPDWPDEYRLRDYKGYSSGSTEYAGKPAHGQYNIYTFEFDNYIEGNYYYLWVLAKDKQGNLEQLPVTGIYSIHSPLLITDKLIDTIAPEFDGLEYIGELTYNSGYYYIHDPDFLPFGNKNSATLNEWVGSRKIIHCVNNEISTVLYINTIEWDSGSNSIKFLFYDQSGLNTTLNDVYILDGVSSVANIGSITLSIPICSNDNLGGFLLYRRNSTDMTPATNNSSSYTLIKFISVTNYVDNNLLLNADDLQIINNQKYQYKIVPISKYTTDGEYYNSSFSNIIKGKETYNNIPISNTAIYRPVSGSKPTKLILSKPSNVDSDEWYSTYNNGSIKLKWCRTGVPSGSQPFSTIDVNQDIRGFRIERAREEKIGLNDWALGGWELLSDSDYSSYPNSGEFQFSYLDTKLESYNTDQIIDVTDPYLKLVRYQYRIAATDYGGNLGEWAYFSEPSRSIASNDSTPPNTSYYELKVTGRIGEWYLEFYDSSKNTVEIEVRRRRVVSSGDLTVLPVDGNDVNTIGRFFVDSGGVATFSDTKPPATVAWYAQYQVIGKDKNGNWTEWYPTSWSTSVPSLTLTSAVDSWAPKSPTNVNSTYTKTDGRVLVTWTLPTEELILSDTIITSRTGLDINVTNAGWINNSYENKFIRVLTGTGAGTTGKILSNVSDTISVEAWSGTPPESTSVFEIYSSLVDLDTITVIKSKINYDTDTNTLEITSVDSGNNKHIYFTSVESLTLNELTGLYVKVSSGDNKGTIGKILTNDADELIVESWVGTIPAVSDELEILTNFQSTELYETVGSTNSSSVNLLYDYNTSIGLWQYFVQAVDLSGNKSLLASSQFYSLVADYIPPASTVVQSLIGGIGILSINWGNISREAINYYKIYIKDKDGKSVFTGNDGFFNSGTRSTNEYYKKTYSSTYQLFNVSDTKQDVAKYSIKIVAEDLSGNISTNTEYIDICTTFDINGNPIEDPLTSSNNGIIIYNKNGTVVSNSTILANPALYYSKAFLDEFVPSNKTAIFNEPLPSVDFSLVSTDALPRQLECTYTDLNGNIFIRIGTGANKFSSKVSKVAIYKRTREENGLYGDYVFYSIDNVMPPGNGQNYGLFKADLGVGNVWVQYRIHCISASNILDTTGVELSEIRAVDVDGFDLDSSHDDFSYSTFHSSVNGSIIADYGKFKFRIPDILSLERNSYFEIFRSPYRYYNSTNSTPWSVDNFYKTGTLFPYKVTNTNSAYQEAWERIQVLSSTPGMSNSDYFVIEDNDWSMDGDIEDSRSTIFSNIEYQNHAVYAIVATDKWGNRGKPYFIGGVVNGNAAAESWITMPAWPREYYVEIKTPFTDIKFDADNNLVAPSSSFAISAQLQYGTNVAPKTAPYFRWQYNDTPDLSGTWTDVPGQNNVSNESITISPSNWSSINIRTYRVNVYSSYNTADNLEPPYTSVTPAALILATDTQGIVKITNGEPTVYAILTKDSASVPCESDNSLPDLSNASTTMRIYRGFTEVTSQYIFTRTHTGTGTTSVTPAGGTNSSTFSLSQLDLSNNTVNITITATKSGSASLIKTFSISRLPKGEDGKNATNLTGFLTGKRSYNSTIYDWDGNYNVNSDGTTTPGTYYCEPLIYVNGELYNSGLGTIAHTVSVVSGNASAFTLTQLLGKAEITNIGILSDNSVIKVVSLFTPTGGLEATVVTYITIKIVRQAVNSFKSIVFTRSNSDLSLTTLAGGSFSSPLPTNPVGWTDGIPSGNAKLWSASRIFTQNGLAPQGSWSTPVQLMTTQSIIYKYSVFSGADPGTPDTPLNGAVWIDTASTGTIWMAVRTVDSGVNSSWSIIKIKGEAGADSYTVQLTNENHTVHTNSSNEPKSGQIGISGQAKTTVKVYKANTEVPFTINPISAINGWTFGVSSPNIYVSAVGSASSLVVPIEIQITGGPLIIKNWSLDKKSSGIVNLKSSVSAIQYASNNDILVGSNNNITFTATAVGIDTPEYKFYSSIDGGAWNLIVSGTGGYSISNNILTLSSSTFNIYGTLFSNTLGIKVTIKENDLAITTISDFDVVSIIATKAAAQGATGSSGQNSRSVDISTSRQVIEYNNDASIVDSSPIQFIATQHNATINPITYTFYIDGIPLAGTTSVQSYTAPSTYFSTPKLITVDLKENGVVVATDTISIYATKQVEDGKDAIIGMLTNEAHTVSTDSNGGTFTLTGAGGTFKVYEGITDVTSSAVFGIVTQSGSETQAQSSGGDIIYSQNIHNLSLSINNHTGVYTLNNYSGTWSTALETFTLSATYKGLTLNKVYSISKSIAGIAGKDSLTIVCDNSSHTVPSNEQGAVTSYIGSGATIKIYEGTTILTYDSSLATGKYTIGTPTVYPSGKITVGTISGTGSTTGIIGNHSAMDSSTDTVTITYPVTVRRLVGTPDVSINVIQTITKSKAGAGGRTVKLTSTSLAFTYNSSGTSPVGTSVITATKYNSIGTAWYRFLKNGIEVQGYSTQNTINYTPQANYSSMPDKISVELKEGDGAASGNVLATDEIILMGIKPSIDGESIFTATIFKQASYTPSQTAPTGGSYNFVTNTLTPPSGWVVTQPITTTTPTWASQCTFKGTSTTTNATGTWSAPIIDAVRGTDGQSIFIANIYKQSSTSPNLPTGGVYNFGTNILTTVPSGWSVVMPETTIIPTYISSYKFVASTPQEIVSVSGAWSAPVIVAQKGTSVIAQYSVDPVIENPSSWHSNFQTNDVWMRTSEDGGISWGNSVRIVGEEGKNGKDTIHIFRRNLEKPTIPVGNDPTNGDLGPWYDGPPVNNGQKLWMSKGEHDPVTNITEWTSPIHIDGDESKKPEDTNLELFYDFNDFKKLDTKYTGNKLYDKSKNSKDANVTSKIIKNNSASSGLSLSFIDQSNIIITPSSDFNINDYFSFTLEFKIYELENINILRGLFSCGINGVNGFKIGIKNDGAIKLYSYENGGAESDFIETLPGYISNNTLHVVTFIYANGTGSIFLDDQLHTTKAINIINGEMYYKLGDPIYDEAIQTESDYKYVFQRSLTQPATPEGSFPENNNTSGWKTYVTQMDDENPLPIWFSKISIDNLLNQSRYNTGLQLQLNFDEELGNIVNDISGNNINMVIDSSYENFGSDQNTNTYGNWSTPKKSIQYIELSNFKIWSRAITLTEAKGIYKYDNISTVQSGEQIIFGSISSSKWSYTNDSNFVGTKIDLDNDKIYSSNGIYKGTITALSGKIGNWNILSDHLYTSSNNFSIGIHSGNNPRFEIAYGNGDGEFIELGKITKGIDANKFGLSYYDTNLNKVYFTLTEDKKKIGGWNFDDKGFYGDGSNSYISTNKIGDRIELNSLDKSLSFYYGNSSYKLKVVDNNYMAISGGVGLLIGDNGSISSFVGLYKDTISSAIYMQAGSTYRAAMSLTNGILKTEISGNGSIVNYINDQLRSTLSSTGLDIIGYIKPSLGFKSADGTNGFTGNIPMGATINVKNGIITGYTN